MTPEGRVKAKVKKVLAHYRAYYHMPVQNGMGKPTLDFIGCSNGFYFGIETKARGETPTKRQEVTIEEIQRSKGKVFVIDGDCTELEVWLTCTYLGVR